MKHILGGFAALALVATGAIAKEHGNGNGPDVAKGKLAPSMNSERGSGNAKPDRGPQMREVRAPDNRPGNSNAKENRATEKRNVNVRPNGVPGAKPGKRAQDDVRIVAASRPGRLVEFNRHGLIQGCPPGLAKKNNGCRPPGLARNESAYRYQNRRPEWWGLSGMELNGGRYFYDDGYLVRLGTDGRIGGYIPLLGGALAIGQPWPTYYQPVVVPRYYVDYYGLGPDRSYRYANNVLYRVDPETAAITSVAALLTGNDIAIGQPMPAGYGVYNVPYDYRDRYSDGPDNYYRYSDGYIYQVDPKTQLVASAIQLLI